MLALGVGFAVGGPGDPERQLGAEDRREVVLTRREREAHRAVETVVVGDRQPGQPEARRLLRQLLGVAGAVEEGEVGVAVQLGVAMFGEPHGIRDRIERMFGPQPPGEGARRPLRSRHAAVGHQPRGRRSPRTPIGSTSSTARSSAPPCSPTSPPTPTTVNRRVASRSSPSARTRSSTCSRSPSPPRDHTPMFGRGPIDHIGLQAESQEAFDEIRRRLIERGSHRRLRHRLRRRHQPLLHRSRRTRGRGGARQARHRARRHEAAGHAGRGVRARPARAVTRRLLLPHDARARHRHRPRDRDLVRARAAAGRDTLYLLAGAGEQSDWVRNLQVEPSVRVRIDDVTHDATRTRGHRSRRGPPRAHGRVREVPAAQRRRAGLVARARPPRRSRPRPDSADPLRDRGVVVDQTDGVEPDHGLERELRRRYR